MTHGGEWPEGLQYGETDLKADVLDFSVNCNPLGLPASAEEALLQMLVQNKGAALSTYPDRTCDRLRNLYAEKEGISAEHILCTNGASEGISLTAAVLRPKKAVILQPTFSGYERALCALGAEVVPFPLLPEEDFAVTNRFLSFLQRECPDAVFFCNPNNPTGRLTDTVLLQDILQTCEDMQCTLVLDECFLGMAGEADSLKKKLRDNPHLILIDAFTKRFALAGLRLGFFLSSDIMIMKKALGLQPEWAVSSVAETTGCAILTDVSLDAYCEQTAKLICTERKFLTDELRALKFNVVPSDANFLLFSNPKEPDTKEAYGVLTKELMKCNIRIRDCASFAGLGKGYYRIAVKSHQENERLIRALKELQ